MRIKILGTGTSIPSLKRNSSSYLVEEKGKRILVDIGPSIVRRLLEVGHHVFEIDMIILTHFHVDHVADLSTFLFACNYGLRPRKEPLFILGGRGIKSFLRRLKGLYPWIEPKEYRLSVVSLEKKEFSFFPFLIRARPMNHNRESVGIKIEVGEKSIVFSGDTDYSKNLIELASECDLLIVECSFPERKVKGHLNLEKLLEIIRKAKPKRVIISHLYPEWDDYSKPLPKPLLIGEDGMELDL